MTVGHTVGKEKRQKSRGCVLLGEEFLSDRKRSEWQGGLLTGGAGWDLGLDSGGTSGMVVNTLEAPLWFICLHRLKVDVLRWSLFLGVNLEEETRLNYGAMRGNFWDGSIKQGLTTPLGLIHKITAEWSDATEKSCTTNQ
ncbi:uncharacterized protein CIMG_12797 [Coccidioides immitis RS]|uniref:Uncharacterized protein n=1 Tax=Coccidioides immitis (strain RS) TaxID=246410 RepID=A0A0D8JSV4_COCIM|nr:uncharacterized protein CIMG_12797 [Coccidioides immitis RS]KJF60194.1 hypothetical protein CIMG_12797 [Coccidioides immitis RS]